MPTGYGFSGNVGGNAYLLRLLDWEPNLFLPKNTNCGRRLQEAVDDMRNRYGLQAITTRAALVASGQKPVLPLLSYN